MKTYDERTLAEIENPNISAGYTYPSRRQTGTEHRTHTGTEGLYPPNGLQYEVPIYEDCELYHAYTEEDKQAAMNAKIEELSAASSKAILAGMDVQLSDGSKKHFTFSDRDQANLSSIFGAVSMGATAYPYHADGESCKMYCAKDITVIYATLYRLLLEQNTYFNQLREYVRTLKTVPEINAVQYGDPLTGVYLNGYNSLISQADAETQKILAKVTSNAG